MIFGQTLLTGVVSRRKRRVVILLEPFCRLISLVVVIAIFYHRALFLLFVRLGCFSNVGLLFVRGRSLKVFSHLEDKESGDYSHKQCPYQWDDAAANVREESYDTIHHIY